MNQKQIAGERAVEFIEDGMVVGLGTGSTVYFSLLALGERVKAGLQIQGIPTSEATTKLAKQLQIPLTDFAAQPVLDITIDGADAVLPDLSLIKGGGGALLREKLVASASKKMIVVADESKQVATFDHAVIPIEVVPFAWETTAERIRQLGGRTHLRCQGEQVFVTDNHNFILDTTFAEVGDVAALQQSLKLLTGVVETGLFPNLADMVIIGTTDGVHILS
ncbi:ribose-5-phosphate isomerase RpiA [Alicyclobacillus dauci]|uniref:Ribose-5-phosphate isomerase A n=1 Tax=Alicyclobacillus dauci TaxID=1475485 RepID=A0ABY6Z9X6_9BACL|nr:ribose-5-phosphate isomerase RpiA [Alicyclobacillus dauci]WAH38900.1 ribose-5-phosphate isomerase RpiA [Alicyclobacillus dauci]